VCEAFWDGDHPEQHCGVDVVEHFAAFPRELARKAIAAGSSEVGCCAECRAPWRRVVDREAVPHPSGGHQGKKGRSSSAGKTDMSDNARVNYVSTTAGWEPTCSCNAERVACAVLDPFGGSGTTAMAARELGRKAVLIELRREYAVMIRERTRQQSLLGT